MSTQNPNFVSELVMMAKAFEELPVVKTALEQSEAQRDANARVIAEREESILRLKAELEASHEARRKVEAERDEAIQSFLDADDRTGKALAFIKATFGNAGSLIQALEPPAPTPVPVPPAEPEVKFDDGGPYNEPHEPWQPEPIFEKPINLEPTPASDHVPSWSKPDAPPILADGTETTGQSAADPTTAPTANSQTSPTPAAVTEVSSAASVGSTSTEEASAAVPIVDPTPVTTEQSSGNTIQQQDAGTASPSNDVGYHNEPEKYTNAWYTWARKMDKQHSYNWPNRYTPPAPTN